MKEMTARNARGNGGNCISALTRPVGWLDARDLEGRPGKLPLSDRREMRNLVGMRVRPEEDAPTRLLPYHGLSSKDASEDFEVSGGRRPACAKARGQMDWRNSVRAAGSP